MCQRVSGVLRANVMRSWASSDGFAVTLNRSAASATSRAQPPVVTLPCPQPIQSCFALGTGAPAYPHCRGAKVSAGLTFVNAPFGANCKENELSPYSGVMNSMVPARPMVSG